ncbi:MAG: glutathione S-transferase family protein [Panacagrimonas sp.]
MRKFKLAYFDFDGGRGEVARLALHIGGIPFEDRRVGFKEWEALREQMPFQALPVLDVDGTVVAQSNTINRYVGRLVGLYPKDDWQALLCDEVMDAVEDLDHMIGDTIALPPDEKKRARAELATGPIPRYLQQFQLRLEAAGGEYFADRRLTVGDLKVWMMVRWLRGGALDHVATDLTDRVAPLLVEHAVRMATQPKIAAYYAARKK